MVYPIVHIQTAGESGTVTINGRDIPPLVYSLGSRSSIGSIFYDPETSLYIKLGVSRAHKERAAWDAARHAGLAEWFAPIVLGGNDWNAFSAIDGEEPECGSPEHTDAEDIAQKLGITDICYFNVIVTPEGQPVIIDYEYNNIVVGERGV